MRVRALVNTVSLPVGDDTLRLMGFGPVTLITTTGRDGSVNAAPHSRATIASYSPPQILISVNTAHDTYRNIVETREFVMNIPGADLIQQIWIAQKHFPYGINELEQAQLTAFPAERVHPPRIKECKAYIECKAKWTRFAGSSCLVLGNVEAISARQEIGNLAAADRAISLNRLIFLSYRKGEQARSWIFAEIGKIHTLTERNGRIKIHSEKI